MSVRGMSDSNSSSSKPPVSNPPPASKPSLSPPNPPPKSDSPPEPAPGAFENAEAKSSSTESRCSIRPDSTRPAFRGVSYLVQHWVSPSRQRRIPACPRGHLRILRSRVPTNRARRGSRANPTHLSDRRQYCLPPHRRHEVRPRTSRLPRSRYHRLQDSKAWSPVRTHFARAHRKRSSSESSHHPVTGTRRKLMFVSAAF
ncbi:hypothetical protein SAMN05421858_2242 [Haladaptatus litoreus]|uniref:Uncharacterized protein n=1 Tax=Haladaptatus litoreus TaxID=553468 RepID=A0A1N6ZZD7_9EURY|nr:hypothetical protein SAMN05421858_2242 [Haladaptatus litoreus]